MEETIGDGWFLAHRLGEAIWRISDHGQDNIYLVAGSKAALLIDTGWGVGDLPAFAARLTPLPLSVANTHGHVDHALGNDQFDRVYIAEATRANWSRKASPRSAPTSATTSC